MSVITNTQDITTRRLASNRAAPLLFCETFAALCCCLLCQFDILWPDITVREHLVLYAVIKGSTWAAAGSVAEQAAAEVRENNSSYHACVLIKTQSYRRFAWCGPRQRNFCVDVFWALMCPCAAS
jgi:hypothetical protein